jgi:transcriptional regulator with XRE-family HTH domain
MREKKEINIQIGEQIRLAREQAKMTQEQFAERIEVSPQYISDLERGVVGISISTLKRSCVVLGTSSDQILFGITAESRNVAIEKRCTNLSDKAFSALLNIVDTFTSAIKEASSNK